MPNWLNEFLIAIGGGATAFVGIAVISKAIIGKIVDTAVEKSTIKLTNRLEGSTKAYEVLLDKEFKYYGKVDIHMATLVTLIQDLPFYSLESLKEDSENAKREYKEHLIEYLKIVPILKNDVLRFQPYIPMEIFTAVTTLVQSLQVNSVFFVNVAKILFENNEESIDKENMDNIVDNLLTLIGKVEASIKDRLTELTKN